jgi:hypothetical protein
MLRQRRVGISIKLGVQRGILIRRNSGRPTRRRLWGEVDALPLLAQQAFDRAHTDAKGLRDVLPCHPTRHRRQHTLPQINRIPFHNTEYAIGAVLMLTAVER